MVRTSPIALMDGTGPNDRHTIHYGEMSAAASSQCTRYLDIKCARRALMCPPYLTLGRYCPYDIAVDLSTLLRYPDAYYG